MEKVYILIVSTEDGEEFLFGFKNSPSKAKMKDTFFNQCEEMGYSRKDWGNTISYKLEEVDIYA